MVKRLGRRGENVLVARVKYLQRIYTSCFYKTLRIYVFGRSGEKPMVAHCRNGGYIYIRGTQRVNDQLQYEKLKNDVEFFFCSDSSQVDEEDWSNNWKDYTNKEKLEDAAQILRKEIMSLRSVFSSWSPPEKEIGSERMIIPKALEYFLDILLCATEKKTLRRERLIKSLGQDLNYSNETKKIIEHVKLGLCTQRKTGSRNFITRLIV